MPMSAGARTQPCVTPHVTPNSADMSPCNEQITKWEFLQGGKSFNRMSLMEKHTQSHQRISTINVMRLKRIATFKLYIETTFIIQLLELKLLQEIFNFE